MRLAEVRARAGAGAELRAWAWVGEEEYSHNIDFVTMVVVVAEAVVMAGVEAETMAPPRSITPLRLAPAPVTPSPS